MNRPACLFITVLFLGSSVVTWGQEKARTARKNLPDGVYSVQRDGLKEMDILPLKDNEVLAVHNHRFLKKEAKEPQRFLVVRPAPEVVFDLSEEPKVIKDGEEVVRLLLKLQPKPTKALEQLTSDHLGRPITVILDGEVVTMHKIRAVIKNGEVQITSCTPGAAAYLVKQLQVQQKKNETHLH